MTYSDIKNAINAINFGMSNPEHIILLESDFIDARTELTDTQLKQLFMILSQASVYKRVQGNLRGYTPSIKVDKVSDDISEDFDASIMEDEPLNEIDPFGDMATAKDIFMAKFGSKGAKMSMVARNTSQNIWKKWESESIEGGITPTIDNLSRWISNKGVKLDLIDIAFRAIGVPNIKNMIHRLPLKQWMKDNDIIPGSLNGKVLKNYLLDVDVKEEDIQGIFDIIGLKNMGTMISRKQIEALETALDEYTKLSTGKPKPEVDEPKPEAKEKPTGDWTANQVYNYILDNYSIKDEDELKDFFSGVGVRAASEQIGDAPLRKILNLVKDTSKIKFTRTNDITEPISNAEERMKATHKIVQQMGGSINKAKVAGQKAIDGDVSSMSELQKLGVAILTARKKI